LNKRATTACLKESTKAKAIPKIKEAKMIEKIEILISIIKS
jgi:hypothetical protein